MYDPYRRIFQAEPVSNDFPEWVPMGDGEDQGQQIGDAAGTFAGLLKQRMTAKRQGGERGGMMGAKLPDASAGMMGAKGGGGMQSL